MADKTSLVAEITAYLTKLFARLAKTSGRADEVLYVDNPNGGYSFVKAPVVQIRQVATTANEVTQAKAAIAANPAVMGIALINQVSRSIDRLNTTNNTWSSTTVDYYTTYVLPCRLLFSLWNKQVWVSNQYSTLKRFTTSGLTPIG